MKTSFYFVLWILIYPLLGLLHSSVVDENSFILALMVVWGLSWLINRSIPDTIRYERVWQTAPVLEDVYTGNVKSFLKRLSRQTLIEAITGVYFCVSTFALAVSAFKSGASDWFALVIFVFFAIGVISRSVKLSKAKNSLESNPTPDQCLEIAENVYNLHYAAYYNARKDSSFEAMIPPAPAHYKIFQIVSLLFAVAAALLGAYYIFLGVSSMLRGHSVAFAAFGSMTFLYGSLAAYFGVKDTATISRSFLKRPGRP